MCSLFEKLCLAVAMGVWQWLGGSGAAVLHVIGKRRLMRSE
jgi:hypothetical protein